MRLLAVWLAAVLLSLVLAAGATAAEPLRGQWHLDQSNDTGINYVTPDSSGNGNDLTGTGQIPLVAGRFGLASAITDQGQAPDSFAGLTTLMPANITLLAWVKASSSPGNDKYITGLGSNSDCADLHATYALYSGSSGTPGLQFFYWDGTQVSRSPAAPTTVWNGQWHMVAGTFDGARVRLYVDGAQVGNGTASTQPIEYDQGFDDAFTIGEHPYKFCSVKIFPGNIDEVRLYGRALTATEISRLAAFAGPNPPPALVPDPQPETPGGGNPPPSGGGCGAGTSGGVQCNPGGEVAGTSGDDTIVAPPGAQEVDGGGGKDTIDCKQARVCKGGEGDDKLKCNQQKGKCDGGSGKDDLDCRKLEKGVSCAGGTGNDKLNCNQQKGKCDGGSGKDGLKCAKTSKSGLCAGGAGDDKLNCNQQKGKCDGGGGKDALKCAKGEKSARCAGGSGNDKLDCKQQKGKCDGGGGRDALDCTKDPKGASCAGGAGDDKLKCKQAKGKCDGGKGDDKLTCGASGQCKGGAGDDKLKCNPQKGKCDGGPGKDEARSARVSARAATPARRRPPVGAEAARPPL